ncbi:MAG TPA: amino acid adenylation domain-containing protein, partial [Longimicrobiaceae bacterium]|nr:amino acid adenylation domain-containing protein [Longimicrobiaceae bacterium]
MPVLDLPSDRPRPAVRSYRGERVRRTLDAGLVPRLAADSRSRGTTLFNTLLASFHLWLARLSGQDDVVVGVPAAGQAGRADVSRTVGYDINVLPLRAVAEPSLTFAEHARRVRRSLLSALEHQDVSLPMLAERLLRGRDPGRPPLFSVIFNVDRAGSSGIRIGDLQVEAEGNFTGAAKFDLDVQMTEGPDHLSLYCDFNADLFDAATVEGWLASFERILAGVADDSGELLGRIDLLPADGRARVLEEWSRGPRTAAAGASVAELVAAQAARTPDAPAVDGGGSTLTYAELDRRANRLARRLREEGAGPEARVGIHLERTPELVVAVLAVLRTGAAYLPLDPSYPAERLAYMLADADARVVVTSGAGRRSLGAASAALVCPDEERERIEALDAAPLDPAADPESAAYVIYTSGSTGLPKGVVVSNGSLAATVVSSREAFGFAEGEVFPGLASYAFDIWGFETFLPLVSGGTVRILPRDRVQDVDALVEELRGADVVHAVPALMREVVRSARRSADGVLTRVRRVFVGGDAVAPDLLEEMGEVFPRASAWVLYGPTEGTVICAAHAVPAGRSVPRQMVGRPLPGDSVYVCDAAGSPLPAGIPGEILIGGPGVARGYLGRPELTAASFVPDPFSGEPGARVYRTGDRARWLHDGALEFLGRTDRQVKVRGFRVELAEVEAALAEHPEVADAVVAVREEGGDRRLVAYVVPATPGARPARLRPHARRRLPDHMVPGAFVFLDALPLTPTGKVDRRALPAPDFEGGEAVVAPRTSIEESVAGIWREVLGIERIGVEESFFALGGHSLLVTRVVSRVRELFSVDFPLRAFFEAPTVADVAARVEALLGSGSGMQLPPPRRVPRTGPLPLSLAQQRLWLVDRIEPDSPAYNMPTALRLRGPLDAAALRGSLDALVRRHETLRTTLAEHDGAPVQVVHPAAPVPLPLIDLRRLREGEEARTARRLAEEEALRPFDLARGPLLRGALLRLADEDHVLCLTVHHVVSDGWSMEVLTREGAACYAALGRGEEPALPELPVQYADFAVWQRDWLSGRVLEEHVAYWKERLSGAPELLEIPTDHPRPAAMSFRGAFEPMHLPPGVVERLEALGQREGATLYMVVLAAFQVLLGKYAGTEDVVVGSTIAGRTHQELEPLIGLFMNTLVLRADLAGDPAFREVLRRVRGAALGAYEHQAMPFEKLVEELRPERSLSHTPVFQVLFELHSGDGPAAGLPGLNVGVFDADAATSKFDLSLALTATSRGLSGGLVYSTDLFERGTARRMVKHLVRVLRQVVGDPDRRLSGLELMSRA